MKTTRTKVGDAVLQAVEAWDAGIEMFPYYQETPKGLTADQKKRLQVRLSERLFDVKKRSADRNRYRVKVSKHYIMIYDMNQDYVCTGKMLSKKVEK